MTPSPPSQRALLAALARSEVDFVLIGGHAVAAHGYERATHDVDIVFSTDPDSCASLAALLRDLDASIAVADLPAPGGEITGDWLAAGGHFVFATAHGQLDALSATAGLDFASLTARAITADLSDDVTMRVCSYPDLVTMKRLAGRGRDQEDLRELEEIRRQQPE